MNDRAIRWGILGTANIARAAFLPALRQAGGDAAVVGSRDFATARQWAEQYGVQRAVEGYEAVLADDSIHAVYIPLPNNLHAVWTIKALRSGKTVLCEKPLCVSVEETEAVLAAAQQTSSLLWESFVFPFHAQMSLLAELQAADAIGEIREIQSNFYFQLRNRNNIRLSPEMHGGALNDVGCYPLRLAQLVFGSAPDDGVAFPTWAPEGVDAETQAIAAYPGNRRLSFSCGVLRRYDTFTRILGTNGEIRLTNPYHPGAEDTIEIRTPGSEVIEHRTGAEPSFTRMIEHIHSVLLGDETPRRLALEDSLATAQALALLHRRMEERRP
jgi:predicted dehydrogenase